MKYIIILLSILAVIYLILGGLVIFFEHTQTGSPCDWRLFITWPKRVF